MGLYVKKSKHGIRIFHSVSDEPIHVGYLKNDDQIRKVLIEQELSKFYKEVVKLDVDVLNGLTYRNKSSMAGLEKVIRCYRDGTMKKEAKSVLKKLKIKI